MNMPISDADLDKMVKSFKTAFDEAAKRYEYYVGNYGAGDNNARTAAKDMATIGVPYLEASKEQAERARRAEEEQTLKLPKTLKASGTQATP